MVYSSLIETKRSNEMSGLTKVTCDVDKDLFKALDKAGINSKKAFCEDAISEAIHAKIQDVASKEKLISDFINL